MKELLEYILDNILTGNAEVEESEDNGFVTYTVKIPQDEVGKVIGKGGKTINSIKNILKIRAIKEGKKVDVQVQEL